MSGASVVTSEQAMLELTLLNAESSSKSFDDVVVDGLARGIPPEILIRLKDLWAATKQIGEEVIEIGKIIVSRIVDFLQANAKLTGALAVGAAAYLLTNAVPLIGPMLAPLLGAATAIFAFSQVANWDETVETARSFFHLLISVLNALTERWNASR